MRKKFEKPTFTITLLLLNILFFILSFSILSAYPDWSWREGVCSRIVKQFCFIPAKLFSRPWTLVTAAFLHADFFHLFLNMFALLMFGTFLERRIGKNFFLTIYFLSAIFGSLMYFAVSPFSEIPALGASAAIFGILGSLAILYPNLIIIVGGMPMPILFAAILWGIISFFGMFVPSPIAHHAHLGGLAIGIIIGLLIRKISI